jgi:uracil-DNA glycosylase family 4
MPRGVKKNVAAAIKNYLETELLSGVTELPRGRVGSAKKETFAALEARAKACTLCGLSETRTNVVFGSGDTKARLMFVGEAPGMDEDRAGLPFVGRAGQLLTKIIESIGIKRSEVYIANVLKCRPPENRNPLPTEIVLCQPYLFAQIEYIKPKVICTLGKFASKRFWQRKPLYRNSGGIFSTSRDQDLCPRIILRIF